MTEYVHERARTHIYNWIRSCHHKTMHEYPNYQLEPAAGNLNPDFLRLKNPLSQDDRIIFKEEGHQYFVRGELSSWASGSSVIKEYCNADFNRTMISTVVHKALLKKCESWIDFRLQNYREPLSDEMLGGHFTHRNLAHVERFVRQLELLLEEKSFRPSESAKQQLLTEFMTRDDVINGWEQAQIKGKELHRFIEYRLNGINLPIPEGCFQGRREYEQAVKFIEECGYEFLRTELLVYSEELCVTGAIDAVVVTERDPVTGDILAVGIVDHKRTSGLADTPRKDRDYYSARKTPMTGVFAGMFPTARLKYTVQLSIYAFILQLVYGWEISWLRVVTYNADDPTYRQVELPYAKKLIGKLFRERTEYNMAKFFDVKYDEEGIDDELRELEGPGKETRRTLSSGSTGGKKAKATTTKNTKKGKHAKPIR